MLPYSWKHVIDVLYHIWPATLLNLLKSIQARAWDKLIALGTTHQGLCIKCKPCVFGSKIQAQMLYFREFSYPLSFTVLEALSEWQGSLLAVDGVMRYTLQLHWAHRLAETRGAALPGEFFHPTQSLRATRVLQRIYANRKPTDLPFQASIFFNFFLQIRDLSRNTVLTARCKHSWWKLMPQILSTVY